MLFLQHSARVNTPNIDEGGAFDHMRVVVRVHGRVAMRGKELDISPDRRYAPAGFENEAAVLVPVELIARPGKGFAVQLGEWPVRCEGFETGIKRHLTGDVGADDASEQCQGHAIRRGAA